MALAPATWSKLVEDERTKIIVEPFVGFFDIGGVDPNEIPDDVNDLLDAEAALIPRMILILRKLARIREAAARPAPLPRRGKIGRNDPCPCGSGKKHKRAALAPDRQVRSKGRLRYNARQVEHAVAAQPPLRVEIVKRPDDSSGFIVLPRRWVVERTFSWFGRNRRLAKDYENLADTLAAFITLACIQLAVRRLARP